MLILEIAAGIVLGAFVLALVPVVLELLAEGWRLFWEFVEDAVVLVFFTIPRAIWHILPHLSAKVHQRKENG